MNVASARGYEPPSLADAIDRRRNDHRTREPKTGRAVDCREHRYPSIGFMTPEAAHHDLANALIL
jgi:hypothetical protein